MFTADVALLELFWFDRGCLFRNASVGFGCGWFGLLWWIFFWCYLDCFVFGGAWVGFVSLCMRYFCDFVWVLDVVNWL